MAISAKVKMRFYCYSCTFIHDYLFNEFIIRRFIIAPASGYVLAIRAIRIEYWYLIYIVCKRLAGGKCIHV